MSDQVTVADVRNMMVVSKPILPLMNEEEYVVFLNLMDQVLMRYQKETYPDMELEVE